MKTRILLFAILLVQFVQAQTFSTDADIRSRFEYRHGFRNLIPEDIDPAAFVVQRTRLNFGYTADKLKVVVSIQDVRQWGDTQQIATSDGNNSLSLFQAWAELNLSDAWSVKLGRQPLVYDDQRILGGLDWAMQGRVHDLAMIKFKDENTKLDVGFAFNQNNINPTGGGFAGTTYNLTGAFTYKAMEFAHFNQTWGKASLSLLFMNNTFENTTVNDFYHRQTTGTYFKFPIGSVNISGSGYYQFGEAAVDVDLAAYQVMLEASYKPGKTLFALGYEMLSGTDANDDKNKTFIPLYGTNHKFNGFMDHFYVGKPNPSGLNDLYAKAVFKTGEKSSLLTKVHYFAANAELAADADKYLGTEVDLVYTQSLMKNVALKIGYSHLFAGDSLEGFPGNTTNPASTQNWGWAMLVIKPSLFKHTFTPPAE